ncbi:MAG: acetylglutamate kinase [Pyrinomonadaceae bacterium]
MKLEMRLDSAAEALPYIQRFKGQTFVVKLSGKATEDRVNLASLMEEVALLHQVGIRMLIVHGGGKQLNELAERMGVAQTIINGRRVTDDATLDMAKMIFAGVINTDILAALRHRGVEAVGISGVDANIVKAVRRPPSDVINRETGAHASGRFRARRRCGGDQRTTCCACCLSMTICRLFLRLALTRKATFSISTPTPSPLKLPRILKPKS